MLDKIVNLIRKKKSFSKDILYNIIASLVLTGTMQVIVYPFLAWKFSSVQYGKILTIIGILQTISVTFGNSLNNTRLLFDAEYKREKVIGDFNIIMLVVDILAVIACTIVFGGFFGLNKASLLFLLVYISISTANIYFGVAFRIILNFKKFLIQRLIGAAGFLGGLLLVYCTDYWILAFLLSEVFQLVFIVINTELYREPLVITAKMKRTLYTFFVLVITTLSGNLINYMDRLILYPLMGGEAVSTYSVASFFGKGLSILMVPISGVLLSYYSQDNYLMTKRKFWLINSLTLLVGVGFSIVSLLVAPFFTRILYPGVYPSSREYIFLANNAAIISIVCNITQSAVLKFAPTWIQLIKEALYGAVYILFGFIMLERYGLFGFCIAAISANTIKLLVLYLLGGFYISNKQKQKVI